VKLFGQHESKAAKKHAAAAGQALQIAGVGQARLFDQDLTRLIETARACGMTAVRVVLTGTPNQHVLLLGAALDVALAKTLVRAEAS
jgi:hypothetical protein